MSISAIKSLDDFHTLVCKRLLRDSICKKLIQHILNTPNITYVWLRTVTTTVGRDATERPRPAMNLTIANANVDQDVPSRLANGLVYVSCELRSDMRTRHSIKHFSTTTSNMDNVVKIVQQCVRFVPMNTSDDVSLILSTNEKNGQEVTHELRINPHRGRIYRAIPDTNTASKHPVLKDLLKVMMRDVKPIHKTPPAGLSFDKVSKRELYQIARERKVSGRSKMSREELVIALRKHQKNKNK